MFIEDIPNELLCSLSCCGYFSVRKWFCNIVWIVVVIGGRAV